MDDIQIRIACINAAVQTAGNPNHVVQAREYYAFVTENVSADKDISNPTTADVEAATSGKKGSRK